MIFRPRRVQSVKVVLLNDEVGDVVSVIGCCVSREVMKGDNRQT